MAATKSRILVKMPVLLNEKVADSGVSGVWERLFHARGSTDEMSIPLSSKRAAGAQRGV
jgi:hypothetical protein